MGALKYCKGCRKAPTMSQVLYSIQTCSLPRAPSSLVMPLWASEIAWQDRKTNWWTLNPDAWSSSSDCFWQKNSCTSRLARTNSFTAVLTARCLSHWQRRSHAMTCGGERTSGTLMPLRQQAEIKPDNSVLSIAHARVTHAVSSHVICAYVRWSSKILCATSCRLLPRLPRKFI